MKIRQIITICTATSHNYYRSDVESYLYHAGQFIVFADLKYAEKKSNLATIL